MDIQKKQTETYVLSKLERLDPVTVYVTNYNLGQGKIVIECFGEAWAYYWGSMGDRTLQQFVLSADNAYLANKLVDKTEQTDFDKIQEDAKKLGSDICAASDVELAMQAEEMVAVFGDDWYMDLPTCSTSEYRYVCRILDAVKEAFAKDGE